jgi:hypothetical protein
LYHKVFVPRKVSALLLLLLLGWAAGAPRAGTLSGQVEIWENVEGQPSRLEDRRNAVIFVAGFNEPPDPNRHAQLIQHHKSFAKRVLVVTQGASVEFPNEDPIYHNVWSRSPARPFDLGLFKAPQSRTLVFPKVGIVTVFCNIHPQMIATILVVPNTKFAVTGPDGSYRIENIPPGDWPVYAWVEGAQPIKQQVHFEREGTQQLSFRLTLQRIPIHHLNKEGKPYKRYPYPY